MDAYGHREAPSAKMMPAMEMVKRTTAAVLNMPILRAVHSMHRSVHVTKFRVKKPGKMTRKLSGVFG